MIQGRLRLAMREGVSHVHDTNHDHDIVFDHDQDLVPDA